MTEAARLAILLHAGAAAASLVLFAVVRPPAPARLAGRSGALAVVGRWAYWATRPLVEGAAAVGLSANAITLLGVAITVAGGYAASLGEWGWAGLLLVWGSVCDMLDGEVARATGTQGPAGAFLDSNLDRLSEIALFAGLAGSFQDRAGPAWAWAALAASLMVSYARARGEGLGVSCPPFGMERPHRLVAVMAGLLAAPFLAPASAVVALEGVCAVVAVGAGATAIGRIAVIHHMLRRAQPDPAPDGAADAADVGSGPR